LSNFIFLSIIGELGLKKEFKSIKDDLNNEIKELKGMVGQIRRSIKNPIDEVILLELRVG